MSALKNHSELRLASIFLPAIAVLLTVDTKTVIAAELGALLAQESSDTTPLDLDSKNIMTVPDCAFCEFTQLEYLYLRYNEISKHHLMHSATQY